MKSSHRTMIALATTATLIGGGLAVQSQAHAQSDPSVLTYNIKQGQQVREKVTRDASWDDLSASDRSEACSDALAAVANDIKDSGASVVALQEVDQYAHRSCGQDQAAEIAELLRWPTPCFKGNASIKGTSAGRPGTMGNAILSKSGVSNCRRVATMHSSSETRGVVGATTTIDGTRVTVLTPHLSSKSEQERIDEAKVVGKAVNQVSGPVVLTGDFNAKPASAPISHLTDATGMTDSLPARGNESPTTPGGSRIDHVLVKGLVPTGAKVLKQSETSDHFPVRVNVRLARKSGEPYRGQSSAKPLTSRSATPSATSTPRPKSKKSPSTSQSTAPSTSSTSGRTAQPSTRATTSPSATPSSDTASRRHVMKGGSSGSRSSGLRVR